MRAAAFASCLFFLAAAAGCSEPRPRVTLVGIDGATWHVVDPLLARGELPHLRQLIESGGRARLRAEPPLLSPPIWTTLATGVPREQHGLLRFELARGELVSAAHRKAPALWNLASRAGLRVAVVGWWGTYPAEAVNGVVVSERALKAREVDLQLRFNEHLLPPSLSRLVHPPELLRDLGPRLFRMPERAASEGEADWLLRRVRAEDEMVVDALGAARKLAGDFDLELLLLRAVDPVSHVFWRHHAPDAAAYAGLEPLSVTTQERYGDAVVDAYRRADALLGSLALRPTAEHVIVVVSDHGFEPRVVPARGLAITGHHQTPAALHGIFVAAGGPVRPLEAMGDDVSIYDIAPTVLHLLGLEVPVSMPGRVLHDRLESDWVSRHAVVRTVKPLGPPTDLPPAASAAGEARVDAKLREELRALGYLE